MVVYYNRSIQLYVTGGCGWTDEIMLTNQFGSPYTFNLSTPCDQHLNQNWPCWSPYARKNGCMDLWTNYRRHDPSTTRMIHSGSSPWNNGTVLPILPPHRIYISRAGRERNADRKLWNPEGIDNSAPAGGELISFPKLFVDYAKVRYL